MPSHLEIALVSPHAWPAHDDLTWRIEQEAAALARAGHAVSILTPVSGQEILAESRRRLRSLREGRIDAVRAAPGEVLTVPLGRALPAGPRRRIGGPLDLAAALEDVLSRVPFDVVHVHEPLAPSPALAALRHAGGVTAATFYRPEQLAGVAFVRPLVDRAIARVDVWMAATETARRAVAEMFGRECTVVGTGVDLTRFAPSGGGADGPPPLVIVARGADRAGARFGLGVVRSLDPGQVGPITIIGPAEAPWRTRAAIPKALRDRVVAVPDAGPKRRAGLLATGGIALIATPDDLGGSVASEAMARGMTLLVPRCAEADALIAHGQEGLALPPFQREAWAGTLRDVAADSRLRDTLGASAAARAGRRGWDAVGRELEALYRDAMQAGPAVVQQPGGRIIADLRVQADGSLTPREIVDAAIARGVGAVAVIASGGIDAPLEAARLARSRLVVIAGQQIHSRHGDLVGLFLHTAVPDGLDLEATADAVHGQGGLVMAPHPVWGEPPSQDLLRRHRGLIDCFEAISGATTALRAGATGDTARLAQRFGMLVTAGSGAATAEEIGSAHLRMHPFSSPREFLDALVDAEPVQRRRGLRTRMARERRRPGDPST